MRAPRCANRARHPGRDRTDKTLALVEHSAIHSLGECQRFSRTRGVSACAVRLRPKSELCRFAAVRLVHRGRTADHRCLPLELPRHFNIVSTGDTSRLTPRGNRV